MLDLQVSVITPVFKPRFSDLRECLASVSQTGVEHILVLDGVKNISNLPRLRRLVSRYGARLHVRTENGGISAATNEGAALAQSEFLLFLDQDDFLELGWFEHFKHAAANADFIYSDMYLTDQKGKVLRHDKKPAWSPVRLAFNMYACHFMAFRKSLFDEVGGMRSEFDGAQDHDLALRISRRGPRVVHIPYPLYNWRQSDTSTAMNPESKPYAYSAGLRASQNHLEALGLEAQVVESFSPGTLAAHFPARDQPVSIVIPTGFGSDFAGNTFVLDALRSMKSQLLHPDDEVVLVIGQETIPSQLEQVAQSTGIAVRVVRDSKKKFNFSRRSNIGFDAARHEFVLLMNDDVELDSESTIDQMFGLLRFPNVGLVGSLLLFPTMHIQHGGHYYDYVAGHAYYKGRRIDVPMADLTVDHEVSGVTGALMLLEKQVWRAVGGFSEMFPLNFNDVDFCLKITTLGYSIIQANSALAVHHESLTREPVVKQFEIDLVRQRWGTYIHHDKYVRSLPARKVTKLL